MDNLKEQPLVKARSDEQLGIHETDQLEPHPYSIFMWTCRDAIQYAVIV